MTKNKAIQKALTRLVELKERKAATGKGNTYTIEKPLAWDAAKKALMMPDDTNLLGGGPDVAAHDEIARLQNQLDFCKVNLANMSDRNALLFQRHDLPIDRIPAHAALVKAQDEILMLRSKLDVAVNAIKHLRRDDVRYHSPSEVNDFMDETLKAIGSFYE